MANENCLEFRGICKRFPGVTALSNVSIEIGKGEVHALMGANGAGKSTLIKVLARVYNQDEGDVFLDSNNISRATTETIRSYGIEFIFQELELVMDFSAAQNILIGVEPTKGIIVDRKRMNEESQAAMDELMPNTVDVTVPVSDLSIAKQQLVCIVRALHRNPKILVLDEPTSRLSATETAALFSAIEKLKKERGITVLYISHRLEDIYSICDHVSILRDGEKVGTYDLSTLSRQEIVHKMVGDEVNYLDSEASHGTVTQASVPRLSVSGLTLKNHLENISFDVFPGEVFALTGAVGSQKTELIEAVLGIRKTDSRCIKIDGKEVDPQGPSSAKKYGLCLIPEDRRKSGVIYDFTLKANATLAFLSKWTNLINVILRKKETAETQDIVNSLSIKTPSVETMVKMLSGGNQQKVVIAKWLLGDSAIYFFDEPTVGVDVKGKSEIHSIIRSLASQGKAIVVASSDLEEAHGIGDRIAIMFEGKIQAIMNAADADKEKMTYLSMGGKL